MTALSCLRDDDLHSLGLLGTHPSMVELHDAIRRAARLDAPVVVCGPTGSGKELVARAVHRLSAVQRGPFCAINVAALPDGLIESELFGSARGAFTGAVVDRPGLVESAEGGSLFLDEAGELPLGVQPKLLRLLEYGEARRVGATKVTNVRFRLLVAVQDEPEEIRRAGRWRADFYYRVTSVVLRIPPLTDRRSDLREIAVAFLLSRRMPDIEPTAFELLEAHDWPGNVRELQQALIRAAFYADGGRLKREHIQKALTVDVWMQPAQQPRTLTEAHCHHVRHIVESCAGDTQRAAEILGVSRRHVYRLLHRERSSELPTAVPGPDGRGCPQH